MPQARMQLTGPFVPLDEGAVGGPEHGDAGTETERRINSQRRPPGGHTAVRPGAQAGPPSSRGKILDASA
ncbi:MAG: hypothetical protein OJF50_002053 [Nitrospira sp.]|nr:hypothetical protein [Nitrospira sp.]